MKKVPPSLSLVQQTTLVQISALRLFPLLAARLETNAGRSAFVYSARRKDWLTAGDDPLNYLLKSIFGDLPDNLPVEEQAAIEQGLLTALDYAERARKRKLRNWTWTQLRCFALKAAEEARRTRKGLLDWDISDDDDDDSNNTIGEAA